MTKFVLHGGFAEGAAEQNDTDFYRAILNDAPEGAKILLVCFAKDGARVPIATERVSTEFNKNKWQEKIFFTVAHEELFIEQVAFSDVVYFHGGSTLRLLDALKKIPNLMNLLRGKIVAGESAGANVFAKFYYSRNTDAINEGMGFLPIKIICHYSEIYSGKLDNVGRELPLLLLPEHQFTTYTVS